MLSKDNKNSTNNKQPKQARKPLRPPNGMAGCRGRARRTRSWFILKDSVVFVLVTMCCTLQIQQHLNYAPQVAAGEVLMLPVGNTAAAAAAAAAAASENVNKLQTILSDSEKVVEKVMDNLLQPIKVQRGVPPSEKALNVLQENKHESEKSVERANSSRKGSNESEKGMKNVMSEKVISDKIKSEKESNESGSSEKYNKKKENSEKVVREKVVNEKEVSEKEVSEKRVREKGISDKAVSEKETSKNNGILKNTTEKNSAENSGSVKIAIEKNSIASKNNSKPNKTALKTTTSIALIVGNNTKIKTTTSSPTTPSTKTLRARVAIANEHVIRENVMLPSADPEREAQMLYEQTLKAYHGSQRVNSSSSSSNGNTDSSDTSAANSQETADKAEVAQEPPELHERTLHAVCQQWLQKHCQCTGHLARLSLSCRGIGVLAVPVELPTDLIILDLGNNNITNLEANSFFMVPNLEELTLADNSIINIDPNAFYGLGKLKRLSLQNCGLKALPSQSFQGLTNLVSLQLNGNALASMEGDSLRHLHKIRTLRLEGNLFYRIPTNALAGLKSLEALNLGSNLLTIINDDDFPRMSNLIVLLLKRNQIMKISSGAFTNLTALKVLELDDNLISSLPDGLNKLTQLQEFSATSNRLRWINDTDLPKNLQTIDLRANPLSLIVPGAVRGMQRLRKLILSDVRALKAFPDLNGSYALEILKLDRAGLMDVPVNLCRQTPRLKSLELKTNSLVRIPNLAHCRELRLLDLSSNRIETLNGRPFLGLKQLHDLLLSYNRIKAIPHDAFLGISRLQLLDLEGNDITQIHKDAFVPFAELEDLNLGNNMFPELPSNGLHRLLHLKTFNNPKLREFPAPDTFPRIQTLILSYAYHCCPFLPLVAMSATKKPPLVQEAVLFPSDSEFDMSLWNNSMMDIWPQLHNLSKKFGNQMNDIWDTFGQDFNYPGNLPTYMEEYFEEDGTAPTTPSSTGSMSNSYATGMGVGLFRSMDADFTPGSVQCLPMPGPFLPCADLFDWWTLRCGVWVVFLLALLGNGTVVFVLIFSRSKMDVPRFLVCNLAAADFFMGVYLGILAIVDASTLGEFRMFAIPWQMSVICQIAGFLAVLSSELSVYTLAVITLERNYAITHAIHLNKRLSLKQAGYIMFVGWTFALIMATLPLVGVSDYRKFAVCLPFETTNGVASLTYVIALMVINGCAFLTLMGCYLKMYWAIRGSQAWNTNDSRIAKRMALLVFTDFLCWSPIAFFSITAIFGLQLISLEQAKIFTVFILPLNSCCNPFLYAIMTKQFKKDCVMLCKAFEETRVTRGGGGAAAIGHRGALVERPTKDLPPLLPQAHHPPGCRCLRMMPSEMPNWHKKQAKEGTVWSRAWQRFTNNCCGCCSAGESSKRRKRKTERRTRNARNANTDPYQYQFSEIKQKKQTRASSISSENFCSSRSSSWRNGPPSATGNTHHTCAAIPLKMMDPNRRRHSAWLITRKTSQDSNLSSSRNDSSASATTASTSTFRLSRSSAGSTTPLPSIIAHSSKSAQHPFSTLPKPRLVRQEAVQEEEDSSPPRLGVRFLPTIPSAADSSIIMDDGDSAPAITTVPPNNVTPTHYSVPQPQLTNLSNTSSPQYLPQEHPP